MTENEIETAIVNTCYNIHVELIAPVHPKQLLTYLRITDLKLGLLVNFNEKLIKDGITRIVNNL